MSEISGSIQCFEAPIEFSTTHNENDLKDDASSKAVAENIGKLEVVITEKIHFYIPGGASSARAANTIEVTTPPEGNQKEKPKAIDRKSVSAKSKARRKSNKKGVNKNKAKQQETTPTSFRPHEPQDFIGFYVCKEFNGDRFLGTVHSYSREMNQLKVEYEDERIEYLEKEEVVRYAAKMEDIVQAQRALQQSNKNSEETSGDAKGKRPTSGEGSLRSRKRNNNTSGKEKNVTYRACRINASMSH